MGFDIGVIGTGADPDDPDAEGYAMAYRHARGYQRIDGCELVCCADIVRENAERFADRFGIPARNIFEDYETLLREASPDIVSVCVPPAVHAEIVIGCAETGVVDAIHCEKPMAKTWGESVEMVKACERNGVQLTINHQRRFGKPYRKAKELLDRGKIGTLERIELGGENLYDYGTHLFDLCGFYTDQASVEWTLAAIDYSEENVQFGAHNENMALAQWKYDTGVFGLATTGDSGFANCHIRLLGTDGVVEIGASGGPPLRFKRDHSSSWTPVDTGYDGVYKPSKGYVAAGIQKLAEVAPIVPDDAFRTSTYIKRALKNVVRSVELDERSELDARNALQSTEVIFGCWESARRRGKVEFPLQIADNPLESMVEAGELPLEN